VRVLGDFDAAEEIVQDALLVALDRWPREGVPATPGAWLLTVARNRALDQLRRSARYRDKLLQVSLPVDDPAEPDDRLRLIFTCCHPALGREAQIALTLRTVCGYALFHAVRADLLQATGDHQASLAAVERALSLTANPAERRLLWRRAARP
jgi:predicted RNA polymerase sigma factor